MRPPTVGTEIYGYRLLAPFRVTDNGQGEWTFAVKDDHEVFIKKYLSPKYPVSKSVVDAARARRLEQCESFERHHRRMMSILRDATGRGSSLVVAIDFFREGHTYYKVTEKVDVAASEAGRVHERPMPWRVGALSVVSTSLSILHGVGLVHGDIKPQNVLLTTEASGGVAARLIDFDDCFEARHPPSDLVFTPTFASPEHFDFLARRVGPESVGLASDIFALGLLFSVMLTGELPSWPVGPDGREIPLAGDYVALVGRLRT